MTITSVANQGEAQRAETGGFVSYLSKPYAKNELVDCIAMVLNHENSDNIPFVTRHVVHEATSRIRANEGDSKHTPIIAMTAYAMEGDEKKCKDAGMDEYITKPVNVKLVMEMIEKYASMK